MKHFNRHYRCRTAGVGLYKHFQFSSICWRGPNEHHKKEEKAKAKSAFLNSPYTLLWCTKHQDAQTNKSKASSFVFEECQNKPAFYVTLEEPTSARGRLGRSINLISIARRKHCCVAFERRLSVSFLESAEVVPRKPRDRKSRAHQNFQPGKSSQISSKWKCPYDNTTKDLNEDWIACDKCKQ